MKNLQLLDETIRNLEQETNLTRIKKLMVCLCQGRWENNADLLAALSLRDLIIEVCEVTGTLDNLKFSLDGIVSNINKPQQYALVAKLLISTLGKFYEDGSTQPGQDFPLPPDLANTLVIVSDFSNETDFDLPNPPEPLGPISPEKIFDLRLKVVQHTSPLRAKILIFSALDRLFEFNRDEDWLNLKKIQLDELLQQIHELCPSIDALESHLYETAKNLPEADENYQSAGVIVQYMRPLYSPIGKLAALPDAIAPGSDRWNAVPRLEGAEDDRHVSHDFTPDDDDENDYSEIMEDSQDNSDILSGVLPAISTNSGSQNGSDRKFSLSALKKIDPVQQKQELEKKLNLKVNQSVEEIVQFIENRLNHLEREISDELEPLDIEDGISVKYETMGDLITQVKQATSQFLELLINLEEAERNQPIEREDNSGS